MSHKQLELNKNETLGRSHSLEIEKFRLLTGVDTAAEMVRADEVTCVYARHEEEHTMNAMPSWRSSS